MIFSYYFDVERTHLINFGFLEESIVQKTNGEVEATFTAYIEEVNNQITSKKESVKKTFTFGSSSVSNQHDIDFIRTRYEQQKKWIFQVKNNKKSSEDITIGLITETGNKNPLGFDVYFESDKYGAELKGNNLAQLETTYVPPILTQTLINEPFKASGFPVNFISNTGLYNATYQLLEAKDFEQTFFEPIPEHAGFNIDIDLAPMATSSSTDTLATLDLGEVGMLTISKEQIQFSDGNQNWGALFGSPIDPIEFYNLGFQPKSKLRIAGNGQGDLTFNYSDAFFQAAYNPAQTIPKLTFKSVPDVNSPVLNTSDPNTWIGYKIDNFIVKYNK